MVSIATWKRRKFNEHLLRKVFDVLGLSLSDKKILDIYEKPRSRGAIAA